MDLITNLPLSKEKNDAMLVVVDRLTKMAHFLPTQTTVSVTRLAQLFFKEIWRLHGMSSSLILDRDVRFTSKFWRELMNLSSTHLNMSFAWHPQSDGQTERVNRVLEELLRCFVNSKQSDWQEQLAIAEFVYNRSKHSSTCYSPFYLNMGHEPLIPIAMVGRRLRQTYQQWRV